MTIDLEQRVQQTTPLSPTFSKFLRLSRERFERRYSENKVWRTMVAIDFRRVRLWFYFPDSSRTRWIGCLGNYLPQAFLCVYLRNDNAIFDKL